MTSCDEFMNMPKKKGAVIKDELGFGVHGSVFVAEYQSKTGSAFGQSAVKVHEHEAEYGRERDVYLRLSEHGIDSIHGCHVPRLLAYDDDLLIIEMTIVKRPYVLDFAGAFLDQSPDFSEEVMAEWRAEKFEQFGKRWADAEAVLRYLAGYGIYVVDVNPNNISWPD